MQGTRADVFEQAIGGELVQPRIDDLLRFAADEHLDDAALAKAAFPSTIGAFGGHAGDAAEGLAQHGDFFSVAFTHCLHAAAAADVAGAAGLAFGLAKVSEDLLLAAALLVVAEVDDGLELAAITALFVTQCGGIELQMPGEHIRLKQARAADAAAGDVVAFDVAGARQMTERGADGHAVLESGIIG